MFPSHGIPCIFPSPTHSVTHSSVHTTTHPLHLTLFLPYPFTFPPSPTHPLTHSPIHPLTHPFTHSPIHLFTHSPTHTPIHQFTYSPIHPFIHTTHLLISLLFISPIPLSCLLLPPLFQVVKFHPNGNYVATGSSDKSVRLWDILTGHCVRIFTGHKSAICALAFSPDGKYLASSGVCMCMYM